MCGSSYHLRVRSERIKEVSDSTKFCSAGNRYSLRTRVRPYSGPLLTELHWDLCSLHSRLFALPRFLYALRYQWLPQHQELMSQRHRHHIGVCSSLLQDIANREQQSGTGNHGGRLVNLSNLGFTNDILHISGSLEHTTTTLDNLTTASPTRRQTAEKEVREQFKG